MRRLKHRYQKWVIANPKREMLLMLLGVAMVAILWFLQ